MFKKKLLIFLCIAIPIFISYAVLFIAPITLRLNESLANYTYGNAIVKYNFLTFHQLGLWDIQNGLGYPLMAHLSTPFYLPSLLGFAIPNLLVTTRLIAMAHLLAAGFACYYLLRVLKCSTFFAIFGSLLYVINYYVQGTVVIGGIYSELYNMVWMPLAIAFLWQALFNRKTHYIVFCGIAFAMHITSMTLYATYFTGVVLVGILTYYVILSFLDKQNVFSAIKKVLFLGAILLAVTFGISAIKLLPILEYSNLSMRAAVPLYGKDATHAWELATFNSLGNQLTHLLVPYQYFISRTFLHLDVNILFLILVLCCFLRLSREKVFFISITAICFIATMGKNAPIDLYALFYHFFPGMKTHEHPYRFLIITNLTVPLLAALGAATLYNKLQQSQFQKKKIINIIFFLGLSLIVISTIKFVGGQLVHFYLYDYQVSKKKEMSNKENVNTYVKNLVQKEKEPIHVLANYMQLNNEVFNYSAFAYGFELINPPHAEYVLSYHYFPLNNPQADSEFMRKKYKFLELMNTKYQVVQDQFDDHADQYETKIKRLSDGGIYELKTFLPFVSIPSASLLLIGDNQANDFEAFKAKTLILQNKFDLKTMTIFTNKKNLGEYSLEDLLSFKAVLLAKGAANEKQAGLLSAYKKKGGIVIRLPFQKTDYPDIRQRSRSIMTNKPAEWLNDKDQKNFENLITRIKEKQSGTVYLLDRTPEYLRIKITTSEDITPLRIIDTYFPGWNAFVDRKPTQVYMADGLVKGIIVKGKGSHIIELHFQPISFYSGIIISTFSLLFIGYYIYRVYNFRLLFWKKNKKNDIKKTTRKKFK